MKSQDNYLENDIESLEKDWMRTIYRKQKRVKYWTNWPLENYKEKKSANTKQKARSQDTIEIPLVQRWGKYEIFPKTWKTTL